MGEDVLWLNVIAAASGSGLAGLAVGHVRGASTVRRRADSAVTEAREALTLERRIAAHQHGIGPYMASQNPGHVCTDECLPPQWRDS